MSMCLSPKLPDTFFLLAFLPRGRVHVSKINVHQLRREPIFAFVFVTVLFVFAYTRPAFEPLFALPERNNPQKHMQP